MSIQHAIFLIVLKYLNLVFANPEVKAPIYSTSSQLSAQLHANQAKWKIVGGRRCDIKDHSFIVSLRYTKVNVHWCGGSLISYDWVLSAAHCVDDVVKKPEKIMAVIGYSFTNNSRSQKIPAKAVILHQLYHLEGYSYDISLIQLTRSASTDGYVISIVKLPLKRYGDDLTNVCEGNIFSVAGWGVLQTMEDDDDVSAYKISDYLMCVDLPYINNQLCKIYNNGSFKAENLMCTYVEGGGHDACLGDSGSPLFCGDTIFGIVAFGMGCALPGVPSFFTRVDRYLDFIQIHTGLVMTNISRCMHSDILLLFIIHFALLLCNNSIVYETIGILLKF